MGGTMKTQYLFNLEERMGKKMENTMGHMKNDIVESIVKFL